MENLKLSVYIPPHVPYIPRSSYRSSSNTVQETREMTEEEKNVATGFVIITSVILIIFIIYVAISIHKMSKI